MISVELYLHLSVTYKICIRYPWMTTTSMVRCEAWKIFTTCEICKYWWHTWNQSFSCFSLMCSNLARNSFTGSFLRDLVQINSSPLEQVHAGGNQFEESLPRQIGNLANLKTLYTYHLLNYLSAWEMHLGAWKITISMDYYLMNLFIYLNLKSWIFETTISVEQFQQYSRTCPTWKKFSWQETTLKVQCLSIVLLRPTVFRE